MNVRLIAFLLAALTSLTWANEAPPEVMPEVEEVLILEEAPPDESATEEEKAGYWERVRNQYEAAKDKSAEWVDSSMDATGDLYEKAKGTTVDWYEGARDWTQDDLGKAGTWQYRIVVINPVDLSEPEATEAMLNELGVQRFECYWVEPLENGKIAMFFKKRGFSMIKAVPAKEFWRFIPGSSNGESESAN